MATLSVETVVEAGLEATFNSCAGGGDQFVNTGSEVLNVINGSGGDITVTVTAQNTAPSIPGYGTATKSNVAVVVTAGEQRFIGPFPTTAFNDSSGYAQVTYSGVTSLTMAVVKVIKAV